MFVFLPRCLLAVRSSLCVLSATENEQKGIRHKTLTTLKWKGAAGQGKIRLERSTQHNLKSTARRECLWALCRCWNIQYGVLCVYVAFFHSLVAEAPEKKHRWTSPKTHQPTAWIRIAERVAFLAAMCWSVHCSAFDKSSLKSKRLIIFGCCSRTFVSFISRRTCRKHNSLFCTCFLSAKTGFFRNSFGCALFSGGACWWCKYELSSIQTTKCGKKKLMAGISLTRKYKFFICPKCYSSDFFVWSLLGKSLIITRLAKLKRGIVKGVSAEKAFSSLKCLRQQYV